MGIQLVIGFFDLFTGSLGQNSKRLVLGLRAECTESCGYLFYDSFNNLSSLMLSILFCVFFQLL